MRILFLIQARTGSTRFPNKILYKLKNNLTLIEIICNRILQSRFASKKNVYVLTTLNLEDNKLISLLDSNEINSFRGDEEDVHFRFYQFLKSKMESYDSFVRICSDNPFLDILLLDDMIRFVKDKNMQFDYASYKTQNNTPVILSHWGLFAEIIKIESFIESRSKVKTRIEREHVTPIFYTSKNYDCVYLNLPEELEKKNLRFTLDRIEDALLYKKILRHLSHLNFNYKNLLQILKNNPEYLLIMKKNLEIAKKEKV